MPRKPNTTKERYNDPFPTRLRALMAETNITQEDLCIVLNVKSRQSVTGYIDGSTIPTIDKIVALADYFGVSSDYLLGLAEEKTRNTELRRVCEFTGLSEKAVSKICDIRKFEKVHCTKDYDVLNCFLENYGERFVFLLSALKSSVDESAGNIPSILDEQIAPIDKYEKLYNLRRNIQLGVFDFTEYCREIADLMGAEDGLMQIFSILDEFIMSFAEIREL